MSISSYDLKQIWFIIIQKQVSKHIRKMLAIEPSLINAPDSRGKNIISIMMKENDDEEYSGYHGASRYSASANKVTIEVKKSDKEVTLEYLYVLKSKAETNVPYIETDKSFSDDEVKYLFFLAIKYSRDEQIIAMLQKFPYLINAQNNKDRSILIIACIARNRSLIKMVCKSEILDLDIKDKMGFDAVFYITRNIPYDVHLKYGRAREVIKETFKYYQALNKGLYMLFEFALEGDFSSILYAYNHIVLKANKTLVENE